MVGKQISKIPDFMNAVRLIAPGGAENIVIEQVHTPRPAAGEVLVRVHAAGITRDELTWPVDRLPAIPSYEFSGEVAVTGTGVKGFAPGDPVFALSAFNRDGAAADYVCVSQDYLAPKPPRLNYLESAAVPLAALSAWQGLFDQGHLQDGQRVLIHGASGGVGSFAVQLAHHCGAYVIGTTSAPNVETVRRLGADEVIEYPAIRFEEEIDPVDLVFDTAGGERMERSLSVIRKGGRLVSVAIEPPQLQAELSGIIALYFVVKPDRSQLTEIGKLIDQGDLHVILSTVFPLAEARQAFEHIQGQHGAGKVVLRVVEE